MIVLAIEDAIEFFLFSRIIAALFCHQKPQGEKGRPSLRGKNIKTFYYEKKSKFSTRDVRSTESGCD